MKSLIDVFSSFQENIIETSSIFAGRASGGETNASGCGQYDTDSAGDPETFQECETECTIDPDTCDSPPPAIASR